MPQQKERKKAFYLTAENTNRSSEMTRKESLRKTRKEVKMVT